MTSEFAYQPFPKLTNQFVLSYFTPGWKDLQWAFSNHWLGAAAIAQLAEGVPGAGVETLAALAGGALDDDETAVRNALDNEAAADTATSDEVRQRWLHVAIGWLYRHRDLFADPWAVLEEIWEAFDHPPAINGLIRWMPSPNDGKEGEEGMLERWREYVSQGASPGN